MTRGLQRVGGAAGIGLAVWLGFGPPQDWEDSLWPVKAVLGLSSTGLITGGARLMFWDPEAERAEALGDDPESPVAVNRA